MNDTLFFPQPICPCGCGKPVGTTRRGLLRKYAEYSCGYRIRDRRRRHEAFERNHSLDRPLCLCDCGLMVSWNIRKRGWYKYRSGHSMRNPGWKKKDRGEAPECACGCGGLVLWSNQHNKWNAYIYKHRLAKPLPLCKCGCGERALKRQVRYIPGHHAQHCERVKFERLGSAPLCKCGCGENVVLNHKGAAWNTYIKDHAANDPEWLSNIQQRLGDSPNQVETVFDKFTPSNIKFVGDGVHWIKFPSGRYKNPDFLVLGTKKVIELFGDRWHKPEEEKEIKELYQAAGHECLVIWEHEMRDIEAVLLKVAQYIGASEWQLPLGINYRLSRYMRKEDARCLIE